MIELSHVTKTFGGATRALDDLTLTVPQGAVYGLVGSNGAGKTTAIRHITGIFRQDSGSVTIGGLRSMKTRPSRAASAISRTISAYSAAGRSGSWRLFTARCTRALTQSATRRCATCSGWTRRHLAPVLQGDAEARGLLADAEPAAGPISCSTSPVVRA